jgi:hypothetical protein
VRTFSPAVAEAADVSVEVVAAELASVEAEEVPDPAVLGEALLRLPGPPARPSTPVPP